MYYASWGAPIGQASAQAPQATQVSASISYLPSPSVMQPMGHASTQAPQDTQSSLILNAILIYLLSYNLGYLYCIIFFLFCNCFFDIFSKKYIFFYGISI
jgi:hypothetical protein